MNKIYGGLVSQPRNSRGTTIIGTGITHTFSGEVTETIVIPEEYVVHDVIAPEGDVQIFKDHTCTIYADGTEKVVYARLNTAVGFGEGWYVGEGAFANTFCQIMTPSEESPSDSYSINIWMDWDSDNFSEAFTEGQVVKCTNQSPTFEPVENPTTVFSKPPMPIKQGLYKRDSGGTNGLVVDKNGQAVYFTTGNVNYFLMFATANPATLLPTDKNVAVVGALVHDYGIGTQLATIPAAGNDIVIDGITYQVFEVQDGITLTPDPSAWT